MTAFQKAMQALRGETPLQSENESLAKQVGELTEKAEGLQKLVDAAEQSHNELEGTISGLQSEVATLKTERDEAKARVEKAEGEAKAAKADAEAYIQKEKAGIEQAV